MTSPPPTPPTLPAVLADDEEFALIDLELEEALTQSRAFTITSPEDYARAAVFVRDRLKPQLRNLDTLFDRIKKPMNELRNAVLSIQRERSGRWETAIDIVETAMLGFDREQRRIREAAEQAARAVAEREHAERLEAEALELDAQGFVEAAEELLEAPPPAPAPGPVSPLVGHVPKVPGVARTERWHAEVQDPKQFIRWVAQDPESRMHFLTVNQTELNRAAQAQRRALAIPGVVAVPATGLTFRKG